ncbi:hypothetical protein SCHIN_v1c00530 [Spiroplasma chinense]|uniref:HAD superfamily hydrolase n=1 Tax=Spiroplasma chinense TaxID=216932 RepID=A0A5B9Y2T2_9MOLU|nr:HAD family hydrolase [Spiroplasma chinense]QEH61251.1 hypothetical protein SCHIN_v1c00530 [Spiroplasma chinense]
MNKIIYLDIDGTILDKNKNLGDLTRDAIINVQKKGVKVAFATGRTFAEVTELAATLEINKNFKESICCNGSYVSNTNYFEPENVRTIETKSVKRIVDYLTLKEIKAYIIDYLEPAIYFSNIKLDRYGVEQGILPNMRVIEIDEYFNWNNVVLIALYCPKDKYDDLESFLKNKDLDIDFICSKSSRKATDLFMISSKNTSKLVGIEYLNKKYNIKDEDVYIFGDGINDVEMIKRFKKNAYVPRSAPSYIKILSENMIESPENDGVGKKINQLFDLK